YKGHILEAYLVRILFCLFAEDTTIFNKRQFETFIDERTNVDGCDLAAKMQELFQVLNTRNDLRFKNLDEQLNAFPYVNGRLFEETLPMASFDSKMRQALLDCCYLDWSKISPAIFGSMFQSVMNPRERRNLGAHYTSEKNILKLIKPLFLDDLWSEFNSIKNNKNKLSEFHEKISKLKFLDPACGCGNFLIITYRELRLLELEVLDAIQKGQQVIDLKSLILLNIDQFYGIEFEEFPARIAEVAMYLIDHQMNMAFAVKFGEPFVRLPLKKAATIVHGNALRIDWGGLIALSGKDYDIITNKLVYNVEEPVTHYEALKVNAKSVIKQKSAKHSLNPNIKYFDYIFGNPPFIGKHLQSASQKEDMDRIFNGVSGTGVLDYVTAWYLTAAKLIQGTTTKVAFVSTNSIAQGEQVGVLWNILFKQYQIKIHFSHQTFNWRNEAKGNAAVHCVIIGFANFDINNKIIYEYEDINGEAHEITASNINTYLIEGKDLVILARTKPICRVPEMLYGNKIVDGGNYLFTDEEKDTFIEKQPQAAKYFKPILSGDEFINGKNRWVLYLAEALPQEMIKMKFVMERVENVVKYREASTKLQTRNAALMPNVFAEPRQPKSDFILVPRTSSENRRYLPLGFFTNNYIVNDSCTALPSATNFHFGVLSASMHSVWTKYTCGRLKSDIRYSNSIVYNNFPWPENLTEKQINSIELAAQKVLDVRNEFPESSLAQLYNPLTMPPALVKAHNELDKMVDLAYRPQSFPSDIKRMEFLFELYEKYTADLFTKEKPKRNSKGK
ncbi:MAG TPA: class I SAM-dependent DNA methyltransferase, partial [Bacteroidia bacterium]|nr:class I SAM-dependent DNA methyltransferase [Bacteroidia bacterium]